MSQLLARLGPGLLFAATAVGTSHLVQTTRGSAAYGLMFAIPILAICLIKYPAFHAGVEYAVRTGQNLIDGYARMGRWLLIVLLAAFLLEGIPAITGVSLVAAGIFKNMSGLSIADAPVTFAVICSCALILYLGKYHAFERLEKIFVVIFSALVLITALAAAAQFPDLDGPVSAPIVADRESFFFLVAMVGWMPVGLAAAPMLSAWICARAADRREEIRARDAHFDFSVGYVGTFLLALCFVLIGTAVLFNAGVSITPNSAGFAQQLTSLFVETVGAGMGPIVSATALIVMVSTLFGVMDGFSRLLALVTVRLVSATGDSDLADRYYPRFLLLLILAPGCLLFLFLGSFLTFIDIATTTAFISAPVIAAANHRIIFSEDGPEERKLPRWFEAWSVAGIVVLAGVAVAFLVLRFLI